MQWFRAGVSGPYTIRAYVAPERHWVLPLHCPIIQRPHELFNQAVADAVDDVCVAMRFIIEPTDAEIVREARALAGRLQAERLTSPGGPLAVTCRMAGGLRWAVRRRSCLRRLRMHAPAVEQKARTHLLTMQIQLRLQAPTRAQAECGMARLVATFAAFTSWHNRFRAYRPRRGRRFDRYFNQARAWPGATFVASHEEAHAVTGLPLLALATLDERQVWTRWSLGSGETIYASGPPPRTGPQA